MKNLLIFTAGIIAGFALGCRACKKRYEEIMEEDRQSRRRERIQKNDDERLENEKMEYPIETEDEEIEEEKTKYSKIIKSNRYLDDNEEYESITVSEIDTEESYASVELMVYANGVVCDDANDVMKPDEVLAAIGIENPLELFDDTDDEIYIRNHTRQLDYIITKNEDKYEE